MSTTEVRRELSNHSIEIESPRPICVLFLKSSLGLEFQYLKGLRLPNQVLDNFSTNLQNDKPEEIDSKKDGLNGLVSFSRWEYWTSWRIPWQTKVDYLDPLNSYQSFGVRVKRKENYLVKVVDTSVNHQNAMLTKRWILRATFRSRNHNLKKLIYLMVGTQQWS